MSIQILATVYPAILSYLTDVPADGISLSEARAFKEQNANENAEFANKKEVNNIEDLYNTKVDVLMSGTNRQSYENDARFKITKEDFAKLPEYSTRYANSAFYAEATSAHRKLIEKIEVLSDNEIGELFGIEKVEVTYPTHLVKRKSVTLNWVTTNDTIAKAKNIGELIKCLSLEGMEIAASQVRPLLLLESELVHVSNFAKEPKSFLQRLNKAEAILDTLSENLTVGLKVTSKTLAYKMEDFKPIFDDLQARHAELQKGFNHAVSKLKNALLEKEADLCQQYETAFVAARAIESEQQLAYTAYQNSLFAKKAELKKAAGSLRIIR